MKKDRRGVIQEHLTELLGHGKLATLPEDYDEAVIDRYEPLIEETILEVFEKLPVSRAATERLIRIAGALFARDIFPASNFGLVITDSARARTYPALFAFTWTA